MDVPGRWTKLQRPYITIRSEVAQRLQHLPAQLNTVTLNRLKSLRSETKCSVVLHAYIAVKSMPHRQDNPRRDKTRALLRGNLGTWNMPQMKFEIWNMSMKKGTRDTVLI